MKNFLVLVLLVSLSSCATENMSCGQAFLLYGMGALGSNCGTAKGGSFELVEPDPNVAHIYFFRAKQYLGKLAPISLYKDNRNVGELKRLGYLFVKEAGNSAEYYVKSGVAREQIKFPAGVKKGSNYFVEISFYNESTTTVGDFSYADTRLSVRLVDKNEALELLSEHKRSEEQL